MLLQVSFDLDNVPRAVRGDRGDLPITTAMESQLNNFVSHFVENLESIEQAEDAQRGAWCETAGDGAFSPAVLQPAAYMRPA